MIDTLETVQDLEAVGFDPPVAAAIACEFYKAGMESLMDFDPIKSLQALEESGLSHKKAMFLAGLLLKVVKVRESQRIAAIPRRVPTWLGRRLCP
jgi:hypothetical protein